MPPIVTTSSNSRKSRINTCAVILASVVICAFLAFAFRKPSVTVTTSIEAPVKPTVKTNSFDTLPYHASHEEESVSGTHNFLSPKIIRPRQKGEKQIYSLAKTGTVVRAIVAGCGITSTNVVSYVGAAFNNPTENFIYHFANSAKRPILLMQRFGVEAEAELRKILETDIVIYDDDNEDTVAIKESVASLKQDLLKALEEGYRAADILNEMREDNNNRVRSRIGMQRELNLLIESNLVNQAVQYFEVANEQLADSFLPPLVFPKDKLPMQE